MASFISEDDIERDLLRILHDDHGFEVLSCYTAKPEALPDGSGRSDKRDVILPGLLRDACIRLNPHVPVEVIDSQVIPRITDRRATLSAINANRELDALIRGGVAVEFEDEDGIKQQEDVCLIDFGSPDAKSRRNHYLAVQQLWIKYSAQAPRAAYRRPDVILYVNGLPLVFIELKNSNVKLRSAFDDNLTNYKYDIPQLFHCNVFCILSNAIDTKVGSFTAGWEHFFA